jgi:hypothetical protein
VFSATSTAICMTSVAMLLRILGAKLPGILVACIVLFSLLLALLLNAANLRTV